jgi:hypothetical protein
MDVFPHVCKCAEIHADVCMRWQIQTDALTHSPFTAFTCFTYSHLDAFAAGNADENIAEAASRFAASASPDTDKVQSSKTTKNVTEEHVVTRVDGIPYWMDTPLPKERQKNGRVFSRREGADDEVEVHGGEQKRSYSLWQALLHPEVCSLTCF